MNSPGAIASTRRGARTTLIAKTALTTPADILASALNPFGSSENANHCVSVIDRAVAGDFYELYVWQNSGANRTLDVTAWLRPRFEIYRQD